MNLFALIGIQLLSLALAAAVLFQFRQVTRSRMTTFALLGRTGEGKRGPIILSVLYVLSVLLVAVISVIVFLHLPA